jgi:AraC-like DNA-binding protein
MAGSTATKSHSAIISRPGATYALVARTASVTERTGCQHPGRRICCLFAVMDYRGMGETPRGVAVVADGASWDHELVTTRTFASVSQRQRWDGTLVLGSGMVVYDGPGASADCHSHDAAQLVVGVQDVVELRTPAGRAHVRAAMIPPRTEHALVASGRTILVLVEPAGPVGSAVARFAIEEAEIDVANRLVDLPPPPAADPVAAVTWSRRALEQLTGLSSTTDLGSGRPEVRQLVRYVDDRLDGTPLLSEVAELVRLSPRQLSRLVADEVGMPFRRYVLWRRLRRAVLTVRDGHDLTTASAAAGFADSAHFSRVFRGLFGLTPSEVLPLLEVSHAELDVA